MVAAVEGTVIAFSCWSQPHCRAAAVAVVCIQPAALGQPGDAALQPFAEFETVRSKWTLGECAIDADVASFGHAVLEIEVMCADGSEVAAAEDEIARVAALIGATPLTNALGGKLETYIRRHAPTVLAALIEEGILRGE